MTEHSRSFSWPRRIIPRARRPLHRSFLISIFCARRDRTPRILRGRITSCCRVITSEVWVHEYEGAKASPRRGGRHLVNPLRLRWIDFPPNLPTSCFNHTPELHVCTSITSRSYMSLRHLITFRVYSYYIDPRVENHFHYDNCNY